MSAFSTLRDPGEFRRLLATGRRVQAGDLVVVASEGRPGLVRVGLVAGKKVGTAVLRNRVRRRLREALRRVELDAGFDYVVIAGGRKVVDAPFADVVAWVAAGARRA